ncbi:hypothetical protein [Streptomyces sp. SID161]|uniref:hypothetical protein n=1 Tax=Streptomyces sp. SID161 TaxID=2690251 RepID=UPI00136DC045|nr:hypothetical protein [Streptomyces sp. SID161]MYW45656.1 hypothetical protein [Streptomyces sp. SID161]
MTTVQTTTDDTRRLQYWRAFLERYWEREAGIVGPPPVDLGLGGDWFFRAVVAAAAAGERGEGPLLRLSVDGASPRTDRARYLPRAEDGSVAGFLARMDGETGGAEWSIGLSRLHRTSFEMWERAAVFTEGLWSALGGFPSGYADTDIFLGRYVGTRGGIHCDNAANFMFGVAGPKELVVWPPSAGEWLPLHRPDWSAVRHTGQALRASTTGMGYFPSRFWHVGSSPDAASATFNIALFFDGDPVDAVTDAVTASLAGTPRHPYDQLVRPDGTELPEALADLLDRSLARIERADVADRLLATWLRKLSARGFGHVPDPLDVAPVDHDLPVRLHRFPVVSQRSKGRLLVSANGHLARLPDHPALPAVLDRLNSGDVATPADLAREQAGSGGDFADIVDAVLYRLRTWRAIDVLDRDAP